ncbi:WD40 repeat domain-containing protein [Endozoicomonas sp. SESOKO1]|uniref:WD40 repeat domain-containing protein n=1 Tax=Endozoicomonas sp. SESOKO1 TaxID=2828742 RepID=UPI002148BD97|nr:WD40 repeat domain-containing protein [Endozoicomonas sp. SESOKO1]
MQPIAPGSAATSTITSTTETNERQIFNDLKPLLKSVAAFNKDISEASASEQINSLARLKQNSPPELTILTAISNRRLEIIGLNISMIQPLSCIGLASASQQHEQRNISYDSPIDSGSADQGMVPGGALLIATNSDNTLTSLNRSSTDDSATGSAPRKVLTAEAPGTAANLAVPVNDQLQDVVPNRQPGNTGPVKAGIFHCQTNYLELKLEARFRHHIVDVSFSPMGENLFIRGRDGKDDYFSLKIWRQGANGNWVQKGEVEDSASIYRYELNRSENTLLSSSRSGNVTVSTLNSDGYWEKAVVLGHTPCHEGYPPMVAAFSPFQDKIMSYDPQTGKINVLREDSNGRWILLTQAKEVRNSQKAGQQQGPFRATNHYLLTYKGTTATIWGCDDENNCLEELKTIECSENIRSAQLSHDERHAVIFFGKGNAACLNCDVDGNWSHSGEICRPESLINDDNQCHYKLVAGASFDASGQYMLTRDVSKKVIISGYLDDGTWVGKAEIEGCTKARFSPSGRKILAELGIDGFKLLDCNSIDNQLDKGQSFEHRGSYEAIFSPSENLLLSYGNETNFACIWGDDEAGNLVEKARSCHQGGVDYAAFNPQEDCVLTRSRGTVKVLGLDSQGKWQEQFEVEHQSMIRIARFSLSGRLIYTVSLDKTACILGRDDNGQWIKQTVTSPDAYQIYGAQFNKLENHFLIYGNKMNRKDKCQPGFVQLFMQLTQLRGTGKDGQWVIIEQIKLDHPVRMAGFSPDGDHLMIHCNDDRRGLVPSKAGTALLWKIPASPELGTTDT